LHQQRIRQVRRAVAVLIPARVNAPTLPITALDRPLLAKRGSASKAPSLTPTPFRPHRTTIASLWAIFKACAITRARDLELPVPDLKELSDHNHQFRIDDRSVCLSVARNHQARLQRAVLSLIYSPDSNCQLSIIVTCSYIVSVNSTTTVGNQKHVAWVG
jgi:hypothetical protein